MNNAQSTHFDLTDDYIAICNIGTWANSRVKELSFRADRLARQGKSNKFTVSLKRAIIHLQCASNHDTLSKLMVIWGSTSPFHDKVVKGNVKMFLEQNNLL